MQNGQKKQFTNKKFSDLYSRAEYALRNENFPGNIVPELYTNPHHLLHELQVYQIELEMQNEQLLETQNHLEQLSNKYQALFDFSPTGYFSLNEEGIILEVNFTGCQLLGLEKNELLGKKFYNFISTESKDTFHIQLRKIIKETSEKQAYELVLLKNDGSEFYARLESKALRDEKGNFLACMTNISDISQLKFYINELENARKGAEAAKHVAEKANNFKSEFLASMSHEIRSPLNAILGFAQFLKKKYYNQYKSLFDNLELGANHLMETIHKIIDISRLDTDSLPIRPEPCNLTKIIEESIASLKILADQKGISFTFENQENDSFIYADLYVISHALLNIIDNAIKYTETGSVKVKLFTSEEKKIIIKIIDTGPGMNAYNLKNIFNRFSRGQNLTTHFAGVGLGMLLTKKFIDICGGNINVESKNGHGTIVTIELPVHHQ